jgi:hypothetical protein
MHLMRTTSGRAQSFTFSRDRTSTSRRPSRAEQTSSSGSRSSRTREQSPSGQTRQRQSRGRRCGRRPRSHSPLVLLPSILGSSPWTISYNGVVTTDGAWGGSGRVGGAEEDTASLDGITALPDHGADGAGTHVCSTVSSDLVFLLNAIRRLGRSGMIRSSISFFAGGSTYR